jgi:hypothetical protein
MSALGADKFTSLFIDREVFEEDYQCFDTKWWDYRDLHPAKATMFFYHTFLQIAPNYLLKHVGRGVSQGFQRNATTRDLRKLPTATVRAFWKARMAADAAGVPYDIYIHGCLKHFYANYNLYASTKDGKQILPYPAQMVTPGVIRRVEEEWESERKVNFRYPLVDPKRPSWFSEDMEEGLIRNAKRTEYPDYYIKECQKRGLISIPS